MFDRGDCTCLEQVILGLRWILERLSHSRVLDIDMLHCYQVHGLSGQQAVHAAGTACRGWTGRGQGAAWGLCCLYMLLQKPEPVPVANNILLRSPQPSIFARLTCLGNRSLIGYF